MNRIKLLLYSLATGGLFALAWPAIGNLTTVIFLALVPLLLVEDHLSKSSRAGLKVFGHAYLAFFVFNISTTWWIYHASLWGACMAILCNSLFMSIVFWMFHKTKKWVGRKQGYIGLIIYWIAFEYLHLNWELSWTWLTFGNSFANSISTIQWYEYTGVLGGSLLILVMNLLFFLGVKEVQEKNKRFSFHFLWCLLLFVSVKLISVLGFPSETKTAKDLNTVIIQPNIDPYFDKFSGISESDQIDLFIKLARSKVTDSTDLVLLPETAFPQAFWEHDLEYMYGTEEFRKLIEEFPKLRIITGILCSKLYLDADSLSPTAKKLPGDGWYDNYNAAMELNSSSSIQLHRKSQLVLGAEKVPFLTMIPWMKNLSISLGGSSGRYGTQEKPSVLFDENGENGIGPIICYESIYGEYVNQYAQQGAEYYAIITNDGWWDNTPGYEQHLAYARLRAIEGRRSIVRSANTGISSIIDERGEIVAKTEWWKEAVLVGGISKNKELTFYVRYGDYLGRISSFLAPLLVLLTFVKSMNKTEQRLKL